MGDWNINIQGVGVHHNTGVDVPEDANKMARQFVQELKDKGHSISTATFTHGSKEDINKPLP